MSAWLTSAERVMACISPSSPATNVIRVASDLARKLHASWYGVYVDTRSEDARRSRSLRESIDAVERLGGIVVHVTADSPVEGLVAFRHREGVSHVVLRESRRSRWPGSSRRSVSTRLMAQMFGVNVVVVPLR